MEFVIQWSKIRLLVEGAAYDTIYEELDEYGDGSGATSKKISFEDKVEKVPEKEKEKERVFRACDTKANLYVLQQNLFIQGGNTIPSHGKSSCSR